MLITKQAEIKTTDIVVHSRARDEIGDLTELKESIEQRGLINPVAVELQGDKYVLLAGYRRLEVMKDLQQPTIKASVYKDIDAIDKKYIELDENLHRKGFTFAEEVRLKRKIYHLEQSKEPKTSIRKVADKIDVSKSALSSDIKLAEAIEFMPELAKCKTKHEALKKYDEFEAKIIEQVMHEKLDKRIKKEANETISLFDKLYIVGDAYELIKQEKPMSYNLIELDPPWGIEYNKKVKSSRTETYEDVSAKDYLERLPELLEQSHRVLKANGWLLLWFSMKYYCEIVKELKAKGFKIDPTPIVWNKMKGKSHSPRTMLQQTFEFCLYARKGQAVINHKGQPNYLTHKVEQNSPFATPKSIDMYKELFSIFVPEGSRILSPFLGSGNPILAAYQAGMLCKGFDKFKENKSNFLLKSKRYV